jgi:virginiamycin B lyase
MVGRLALIWSALTQGTQSSDWLTLLPDGAEKRAFVIDCTGCHQFGEQQARPNGRWRSEAQWAEAVVRMLQYAGATTGFPVISAQRDPGATAAWLAAYLRGDPPRGRDTARALPPGASITEFPLPEAGDLPHDLAIDSAGRVIVTGMFTDRMYVLERDSTRFAHVAIPVPRANPRAVEIDASGNWWVVLGQPKQIARYMPNLKTWHTFNVGVYPHSLALDGSGRAWFNGHFTRSPELIGFVDGGGEVITTLEVPPHPTLAPGPGGPIPYEIRAAPDGRIWGSELVGNRIFGYDPAKRSFIVRSLPDAASGPRRFDIDQNGMLWIPAYAANALLRFDPASATFESFPLPLRDAVPYVVRIDRGNGTIWIGTSAADAVLSFDSRTRRFAVYQLPSTGALVRHLAIDPTTHDVWVAYGAAPGIAARIARLRP